jgi:hypothetical protein
MTFNDAKGLATFGITEFLVFVHPLMFYKKHNILETGSVSSIR